MLTLNPYSQVIFLRVGKTQTFKRTLKIHKYKQQLCLLKLLYESVIFMSQKLEEKCLVIQREGDFRR